MKTKTTQKKQGLNRSLCDFFTLNWDEDQSKEVLFDNFFVCGFIVRYFVLLCETIVLGHIRMKTKQIRKKGISRLPCMRVTLNFPLGESTSQWKDVNSPWGNATLSQLNTGIFPFTGYGFASLLPYHFGAKSTSDTNVWNFKNMAIVIILKNYYFRIIIKNLTKCNILSTLALKNFGKFTYHNLGKLCPRSLASTIFVLGLERAVLEKSVLSLGLGFFWVLGLERWVLDSSSGQIEHSTVNGSPPLRHFFNRSCVARRNDGEMGPLTCYTLRRNAASVMKDLIWLQYTVGLNKLLQHVRSNEFNSSVKCWIRRRNSLLKWSL